MAEWPIRGAGLPELDPAGLGRFLSAWASLPSACEQLALRLAGFVQGWSALPKDLHVAPEVPERAFDLPGLRTFVGAFPEAYVLHQRSGARINIWELAGLGSNELRIARVLAWLLNPQQPHGLGKSFLGQLLTYLEQRAVSKHVPLPEGFPTAASVEQSERLWVHVESCPLGDAGNRVDIEIESEKLVLFIEVKVYAGEGFEQLKRYQEAAAMKAAGREWGVLFLTRSGKLTRDQAGLGGVVGVSWREVSRQLVSVLRARPADGSHVVSVLAEHYIRFMNRL